MQMMGKVLEILMEKVEDKRRHKVNKFQRNEKTDESKKYVVEVELQKLKRCKKIQFKMSNMMSTE